MADLEWFRTFVAVYQVGTMSAAAERLMMTQPAVSQHIAALERVLASALFVRTPRYMQPTEAGKALYVQIVGAVEQLEQAADRDRILNRDQIMIVRLGSPREWFSVRGLQRVQERGLHNIHLHTTFGETDSLLPELEDGRLHGVIATQQSAHPRLIAKPIEQELFCLIGASQVESPVEQVAFIQWAEQQPWIAYSAELPIIRRYWQVCFGQRLAISPGLLLPDLISILQAVEQGFGLSVLPLYLCQQAIESRRVRLLWQPRHPPANTLYLVRRQNALYTRESLWLEQVFLPPSP